MNTHNLRGLVSHGLSITNVSDAQHCILLRFRFTVMFSILFISSSMEFLLQENTNVKKGKHPAKNRCYKDLVHYFIFIETIAGN